MTMRDFAREFKRHVGREREVAEAYFELPQRECVLMNPVRRRIFQLLCECPCVRMSRITKKMGIHAPSAKHHLDSLCDREIIMNRKVGKRSVYYPTRLVDEKDIGLFALLSEDKVKQIFGVILDVPGITQKDICKHVNSSPQSVLVYISRLKTFKLIAEVHDGRYRRYFPTSLFFRLDKVYQRRARRFKEYVMKLLRTEGLKPRLIRSTESEIMIQIHVGRESSMLRLHTRPTASLMAVRK
jgi:predicted transcriptional regulator